MTCLLSNVTYAHRVDQPGEPRLHARQSAGRQGVSSAAWGRAHVMHMYACMPPRSCACTISPMLHDYTWTSRLQPFNSCPLPCPLLPCKQRASITARCHSKATMRFCLPASPCWLAPAPWASWQWCGCCWQVGGRRSRQAVDAASRQEVCHEQGALAAGLGPQASLDGSRLLNKPCDVARAPAPPRTVIVMQVVRWARRPTGQTCGSWATAWRCGSASLRPTSSSMR